MAPWEAHSIPRRKAAELPLGGTGTDPGTNLPSGGILRPEALCMATTCCVTTLLQASVYPSVN